MGKSRRKSTDRITRVSFTCALNELAAFFQFVWFHSIRLAFDLRTRHTIYAVVIGGFAQWLKSNAISQNMIQRYLALPTLRDAKL